MEKTLEKNENCICSELPIAARRLWSLSWEKKGLVEKVHFELGVKE